MLGIYYLYTNVLFSILLYFRCTKLLFTGNYSYYNPYPGKKFLCALAT